MGLKYLMIILMVYYIYLLFCLCLVYIRIFVNKNMNFNFLEFSNIFIIKLFFIRWFLICNVDWVIGYIISLVKIDNLMYILFVV